MKQDVIKEIQNKDYIGYIISGAENVSHSAMQIVKRSDVEGIVKAYEIRQNGEEKLIYDVSRYTSLDRVMNSIDAGSFLKLLLDVVTFFHEIKYNTVLPVETVVLNINSIFVDQKECRVKLIVIPVKSQVSISERELYEKNVIFTLAQLMYQSVHIMDTQIRQFYDDCQSGNFLLDDLYTRMQLGRYGEGFIRYTTENNRLLAVLEPVQEDLAKISLFKERTIIGKSRIGNDARIDRQGVSRKHCEILYRNGEFYIKDLGSTNGTKVNGVKIFADQYVSVKTDDRIGISDAVYRFVVC
ncbi:MAG: FHA domain-containing protein [Eubacterium sp.]|nr:FHA domain-containing protein [Eubacterium sp.]